MCGWVSVFCTDDGLGGGRVRGRGGPPRCGGGQYNGTLPSGGGTWSRVWPPGRGGGAMTQGYWQTWPNDVN